MNDMFKFSRKWAFMALSLFAMAPVTIGAEILVAFTNTLVDPQIIAIKAGDTVTWQMTSGFANFTESLGGEWRSPLLTNTTARFSYAFTNTGFFVYRTAGTPGTITVTAWTNPPPAVEIIWPVDDFLPVGGDSGILITPAFNWPTANISKVDYFLNGSPLNLAGPNTPASVSSPPYRVQWLMPQPGALTARVTDKQGNTGWSPAVNLPVVVGGSGGVCLLLPRRLPTGQFMFYYGVAIGMQGVIASADRLSLLDPRNGLGVYGNGVYVDFSATNASQRFYSIIGVPAP